MLFVQIIPYNVNICYHTLTFIDHSDDVIFRYFTMGFAVFRTKVTFYQSCNYVMCVFLYLALFSDSLYNIVPCNICNGWLTNALFALFSSLKSPSLRSDLIICLLALSGRMMKTITINLTFFMTLNVLAITLAITGVLGPIVGALIHNAGSVLVIINSAILLGWKKRS